MRGQINIINTKDDLEMINLTSQNIIAAATITVRHDTTNYPDGYDKTLKVGDKGYIEPTYQYEKVIDQGVLDRFGVTLQA